MAVSQLRGGQGDKVTQTTSDVLVRTIFTDAQTKLRKPTNLKALTDALDRLDWFSAREEGLGTMYEGLLERNAAEKKSGAGQYFTPRPLIDSIVRLVQPQAGEVVQDPAAGIGGFLVAADRYVKDHTDDLYQLNEQQAFFQRREAFVGLELLPDNVLFEDNTGRSLRTWMLDLCDVHTILRLPTGIFYAQGVKTNVLFLTRGHADRANTFVIAM